MANDSENNDLPQAVDLAKSDQKKTHNQLNDFQKKAVVDALGPMLKDTAEAGVVEWAEPGMTVASAVARLTEDLGFSVTSTNVIRIITVWFGKLYEEPKVGGPEIGALMVKIAGLEAEVDALTSTVEGLKDVLVSSNRERDRHARDIAWLMKNTAKLSGSDMTKAAHSTSLHDFKEMGEVKEKLFPNLTKRERLDPHERRKARLAAMIPSRKE